MAPSAATDSSPSSIAETPDNDLQSVFVLHRGSTQGLGKKLSSKSRRKINLSSTPCDNGDESLRTEEACKDDLFERLRLEAFDFVWLKIESAIKDALRNINTSVFEELYHWVHESFQVIRSSRPDGFAEATPPYPVITNISLKLLFSGLVFTKTMEFVDDILMFEELGLYLKSRGCYVAKLSSLDFTAKHGISGCLRSLVKQFLMVTLDAVDMSILASWYSEQGYNSPVVIIIEDVERCCRSILSDFIMMLSEWAIKIPVVLIMGVATMFDAPTNILSSDALQRLHSFKFMLGSLADRMNSILEAVLLRPCTWFSVGHELSLFLRNYFSERDGSLNSFIRALKIACVQHFITEPLSFLLKDFSLEDDFQHIWCENHVFPLDVVLKDAAKLPSCRRMAKLTIENLAHGLAELKRLQQCWIAVVRCLHEAGKSQKIQLLDLYCEALDPGISPPNSGCMPGQYASFSKSVAISQVVRNVRELPTKALCELLQIWEKITEGISEMHDKVRDLQCMLKLEKVESSATNLTNISMRHTSQSNSNVLKDKKALNEKVLRLIEWMLRDCIRPLECMPFHEIICFTNVDKLKSALLGDPRRRIQADLSEFYEFLCCNCCSGRDKLSPSLHDTSIMYRLAREHGDIINLQQWYQSFRATITHPAPEAKKQPKHRPSPKKRKYIEDSEDVSEAAIQARFCRAATELQISGLLRMPSKRRPDYVQTVAFGQYPL